MLPDFVGMARLGRVSAPGHPEVSSGIDYHHRTDAVFHRAPLFTGMVSEGIDALLARGLGRGSARAVAHVGIELLLDGLLWQDEQGSRQAPYRAAIAAGLRPEVAGAVVTGMPPSEPPSAPPHSRSDPPPPGTLVALLQRLAIAPVPQGYAEPSFVAERLAAILAPRPRLALPPGSEPAVVDWLSATQVTLQGAYGALLKQVVDGLDAEADDSQAPSKA